MSIAEVGESLPMDIGEDEPTHDVFLVRAINFREVCDAMVGYFCNRRVEFACAIPDACTARNAESCASPGISKRLIDEPAQVRAENEGCSIDPSSMSFILRLKSGIGDRPEAQECRHVLRCHSQVLETLIQLASAASRNQATRIVN